MNMVWVLVKRDFPGPVSFRKPVWGRAKNPSLVISFAQCTKGLSKAGTRDVSEASVTKLGAFLRRTKLDETPQILNLLRNDMSLVGPRPGLPMQQALTDARQAKHVFDIKPGITGLGQIQGIDMSTPGRHAEEDARYFALRRLLFDFKILVAHRSGCRARGTRSQEGGLALLSFPLAKGPLHNARTCLRTSRFLRTLNCCVADIDGVSD